MNYWNEFDFKPSKDNNKSREYLANKIPFSKTEELTKYRDKVHSYFDFEASTGKMLCEILCDENGNFLHYLMMKVDMIICHYFLRKDSPNNCALAIKEYLDSKNI
jgi:hypothetical protein